MDANRVTPVFATALIALFVAHAGPAMATGDSGGVKGAPISVTNGETARFNVVAYPTSACQVSLGFADSTGAQRGDAKNVTLSPGQVASVTVASSSATREALRPTLTLVNPPAACGQITTSTEVYDSATLASHGLAVDPTAFHLPVVGLASGETLRISVETPSVVPANQFLSLAFADASGNLIQSEGSWSSSPLTGNTIYSVNLSGAASGTRAPVQPLVAIGDAGGIKGVLTGDSGGVRGVAVTAELIDNLTHALKATYVWRPSVQCP